MHSPKKEDTTQHTAKPALTSFNLAEKLTARRERILNDEEHLQLNKIKEAHVDNKVETTQTLCSKARSLFRCG